MPIKKARNHYLGKEDCPRLNCAQSVLAGFGVTEDVIAEFALYGGGKAPEGWCGAAYAAAHILKNKQAVQDYFLEQAGAITCNEIRKLRKLSCIGCVEKAAEFTHKHSV